MPRAVIVGCDGQDGRILWDQLAARGDALVGLSRGGSRVHQADWKGRVDLDDRTAVRNLLDRFRPDQVYYLAAFHHSAQDAPPDDAALWQSSWAVHVQGFRHVLDAAQTALPSTRIFYASSSRIFGNAAESPQTETTPIRPVCIYGITKAMGMMLADFYRRTHGLFVSCGVLFNHESPLRGRQFVSQRIVHGLAALKSGRATELSFGSLDARVDWGYAPDYTLAMQRMLQADTPGDFVVASGETHSVREMIEIAAQTIGVEWRNRVTEDNRILQRGSQQLCGNPARLRQATAWKPNVPFADMVGILARAALEDPPRLTTPATASSS